MRLVVTKTLWNSTADVVVVGFGASGAAAAIAAHDNSAGVVILEKQPANSHLSNSSMSVGMFLSVSDVAAARTYMENLCRVNPELYWTDKETIHAWAEYLSQNKEWLERQGARIRLMANGIGEHDLPGREGIDLYSFRGLGHGLMRFLKKQVATRDIRVLYHTKAERLLTNERREVLGVAARCEDKETNIRASKAVVLCSGGFEYDEEMKLNYLKVYPTYFAGSPSNTGDGIRMAQEAGASLWHMNCCSACFVLKPPDFPIALGPNFKGTKGYLQFLIAEATGSSYCGYIIVDRHGKRYTNEQFKRHTLYYELALYDSHRLEYPRVPSYWIFDRRRIEAGPLPLMFYGPMLHRMYRWSEDNSEEIRKGWIAHAETVEELAGKLGMEAAVLREAVQSYNSYCEHKHDPAFGRPSQALVPLLEPPFFAIKLWPGSANTQGGPRRNQKAQVLDAYGNPIPRLYAAGELGSVYGQLYPMGGGNLAECFAFGRIAGEHAARETLNPG
ncbi:MAG: FAD-dependent oxidoreductase [Chloroflexi bacterium]|nr:FAD-dependent oxidoreductase [Chloroflexota bacterium]MBM3174611.1 FAD-dependent oxidoreductase [Chloroflexota bacterium]MBM4449540.1 FAD-dependent oxidoreductase [Chloroflexota bacterium]